MTDRQLFHLVLRALGGVQEGTVQGQVDAMGELMKRLTAVQSDLILKLQIEQAIATKEHRHKVGTREWDSHMTHCYCLNWDDNDGSRWACKYGEDDKCPAAMYADPYKEWLRIKSVDINTCSAIQGE